MSKELAMKIGIKFVKHVEKEFELIDRTRISMSVAEQCQKTTYELAKKERAKYPEPEVKPAEETTEEKS